MENRYIREFVEHYFFIGINKIIIYDNNEKNGEKIDEILYDYIINDFVTIYNFRGKKHSQMEAYNEMFIKFSFQYEWIMFFDVDEFINLIQYKNIHYFLRDKKYDKCDVIHLQWIAYADNDLLFYDNRPLSIRFTRPIFKIFIDNLLVKSIFKTNKKIKFYNSHTPEGKNLKKCDVKGKSSFDYKPKKNLAIISNFTLPYIKHYQCKTIEEFFLKLIRGDVYFSKDPLKIFTKKKFFKHNKWTKEKEEMSNKFINQYKKINSKMQKMRFMQRKNLFVNILFSLITFVPLVLGIIALISAYIEKALMKKIIEILKYYKKN